MRKIFVVALLACGAVTAHADSGIGVGVFVGEPLGLDLKIGLDGRSNLDVVLGWTTYKDGRDAYGHLTYLATLGIARGRAITVPFRLGVGGALYDDGSFNDLNVAVRAPFEIGIQFASAPIELYGEVALKLTLIDANDNNDDVDLDGGAGLRVYF